MQVTAMATAAEIAVTKEPGMSAEKATEERAAPFSGLLEGLINLRLKGQAQELEPETPETETPLTSQISLAFCPVGLGLQLQGNNTPVAQEENNTVPICEIVTDNVNTPANPVLQYGIQDETTHDELTAVFPEVAADIISSQKAQTEEDGIQTNRQLPMVEHQPLGQSPDIIPHPGLEVNGKENLERGQQKEEDLNSEKQKPPEIKIYDADGVVKTGKHDRPGGKEGFQNREYTQTGSGIVQHKTQDIGLNAILPDETGHMTPSQRVHTGQAHPEDKTPDIINQVVDKMKIMLGSRKTEISIQLKPESLGRLNLKLTVTDGVLDGRIIVQNNQTKSIIQSNLARLQDNLEQQGIPVNEFYVDVGGGGHYRQQQFFQENRQTYHGKPELHPYQQNESEELEIWRGEGTIELLA